MILYNEQWWTIYEQKNGEWVKRVRLDVRAPTQRQLLVDVVRPVTYPRISPQKRVKTAKRRLRTTGSLRARSVAQNERELAVPVCTAGLTRQLVATLLVLVRSTSSYVFLVLIAQRQCVRLII